MERRSISRPTKALTGLLLLAVAAFIGCSAEPVLPPPPASSGAQALPFRQTPPAGGINPTSNLLPRGIQAGTTINIRLQSSLTSSQVLPGASFTGVLDEALHFEGRTVAARGSLVTGKVVGVKPAGTTPGYVRLTLVSMNVNDRSVPVQTSDAFLKDQANNYVELTAGPTDVKAAGIQPAAGAQITDSKESHGVRGRRFTVRLIRPILLPN